MSLACSGLMLGTACKHNTNGGDTANNNADSARTVAPPKPKVDIIPMVKQMEEAWMKANNGRDASALSTLYDDKVEMYMKPMSNAEAVKYKEDVFSKAKDFNIKRINGDQRQESDSMGLILLTGETTVNGKKEMHHYQVHVRNTPAGWRISSETDLETFEAVRQKKSAPMPASEIVSCDKAAEAIFRSSPVVRGPLEDPHTSYKITMRPNDANNPTHRYEFTITSTDMLPGREAPTFRYQVDPKTGDFYQLHPPDFKPQIAPIDPKMKSLASKYCK